MRSLFFLFFLVHFSFGQSRSIHGKVQLPDDWCNKVYLSLVTDYNELEEIHEEQIIAVTEVSTDGVFSFPSNVFAEKELVYRLHVVPDCDEVTVYISDYSKGGFGKNMLLFPASGKSDIELFADKENLIFGTLSSEEAYVNAWKSLDQRRNEYLSSTYDRDEVIADVSIEKYYQDILSESSDQSLMVNMLCASFLMDGGTDLSQNQIVFLGESLDFLSEVDKGLENEYSEYYTDYHREFELVRFQIQGGDQHLFWWVFGAGIIILILLLVIAVLLRKNKKMSIEPESNAVSLTVQEEKIKQLILEGKANKVIAETLFISLSTVKSHINAIYKKEGVTTRKALQEKYST